METTLWQEIAAFDLDKPLAEYGFSTRLAYENGWSQIFTTRAIDEYKNLCF
jgi:hypothetical protein